MIYDVMIFGAGPAGLSCAIALQCLGYRVLVLEKKSNLSGKVCGDGLTARCIQLLRELGIYAEELEGNIVYKKIEHFEKNVYVRWYEDICNFPFEYGISRDVLDQALYKKAMAEGAEVLFETECESVIKNESGNYLANGMFMAKTAVCACGAVGIRSLGLNMPKPLPAGISARVVGLCRLSKDAFHFFYEKSFGDGYGWAFPLGSDIWNIGVWNSGRNMMSQYRSLEARLFPDVRVHYLREPRGAVVGAGIRIMKTSLGMLRIGDCGCSADPKSGEGVTYAIADGIASAKLIHEQLCRRCENGCFDI